MMTSTSEWIIEMEKKLKGACVIQLVGCPCTKQAISVISKAHGPLLFINLGTFVFAIEHNVFTS